MLGSANPSVERSRPWRRYGVVVSRGTRGLLRLCLLLILLVVILIAVITVGARIGLPFLAAYKPSLEERLSEYMQSPVTIAELDTRWVGSGPVLRALGVELTDPQGRQAQFDELLIDVNIPRSIFSGAPVMDELTLIGAKLSVDYDPETGVGIHGVNRSATQASATTAVGQSNNNAKPGKKGFNAIAWLLKASRVGMLDTQVTLQLPDSSSVVIEDINIRVENDNGLHQVRMDLSLPPELGDEFEMGFDVRGDVNDLSTARGDFYVKAADLNAAGIERIFASYALEHPVLKALAERGTNAQLELWGELKSGLVERINGRTAIEQSVADDPEIDSLFGNLFWERHSEGGWRFAASDVVVGRAGVESVFDEIRLGTVQSGGVKPQWVTLTTAETELKPILNTITTLVPSAIPESVFTWLERSSLSSKIRKADLRLSLVDPTDSFTLVAQLDDIDWLPVDRQPGARIATLDVNIVNGVGKIQLPTQSVTVLPPALSVSDASPLTLNEVTWQANVNLPSKSIVADLTVQHQSLNVDLAQALTVSPQNTPTIDVNGTFSAATAADLKPWFTQSWLPEGPRTWIDQAVRKGQINKGSVEVSGTLVELTSKDPLVRAGGVLKAEFDVKNATLKYLPAWPAATGVDARVVFDQASLSASIRAGSLEGLSIDKGRADIDNLFDPELRLSLSSNAPLQKIVEFCVAGPLVEVVGPVFDGSVVAGPARLEVSLVTSLIAPEGFVRDDSNTVVWPVSVRGNVFLTDSDITLGALEELPLSKVRGAIGFTENGIELKTVRANLFGSTVRLNAASTGVGVDRRTDLALRAVIPGLQLLEQFELPVAQFISGSSSWRADASIPHDPQRMARDGIALTVTGDMIGTAISLAQPFGKRANSELPLRVTTRFRDSTGTVERPQIWRLVFGDRSNPQTDVRIAVAEDDGMQGMVLSLGAQLADDMQPTDAIRVVGRADVLSLDGLIENISDIIDAIPEQEGPPELIPPVFIDVHGPHLRVGDTRIGDVSVKVSTDADFINVYINNAHLRGSLRYPREHWRKDIDIKARVNYADKVLIDALASAAEDPSKPVERIDPTTLPPIEIHVNTFDWSPLQLTDLRVRAEPDVAGMTIKTFGFATGTTQLIGEGTWHLLDPQNVNPTLANSQRAQLNLTLQSSNFGKGLVGMGLEGVMAGGQGSTTATLYWPDAIYAPDLESMSGRVGIDIKRGQLLQIEPGAARLVGLFALQTLPRRFNLDFGDLVNDGLDFATITGDIVIDSGVAEMRLVQLNGPVGVVDITGRTDLVVERFNQTVTVLPRVSAALPIIGIITGGATAGIGALIAGGVLKAAGVNFDRIGLKKFSITGSWDDPKVSQIRR